MTPKLKVTKESPTGLNREFATQSGETLTRGEVANRIERGEFPEYHVMNKTINGRNVRIPRSNPDKSKKNNLG